MAVTLAVSEASGATPVGVPVETTSGSTFRSANSRASLSVPGYTSAYIVTAPAAITDGWVRFTFYGALIDTDDAAAMVYVNDASGNNRLRLFGSTNGNVGALQYWNGTTWVTVGSTFSWTPTYNGVMLEIAIKITCGSPGTATLFINGTQVATGSIGATLASFKSLTLTNGDVLALNYSEIIFSDGPASMIGSAVETEAPTGNGADSTDGTGAYTDIDEAVTSDVDTLIFTTAGEKRSFTSPARTGTLDAVLGVGVAARANRGSGGPQNMRFYLTIGGTRYYSGTIALSLGFAGYQYFWPVNPATGLTWTAADANAASLEWGIEALA